MLRIKTELTRFLLSLNEISTHDTSSAITRINYWKDENPDDFTYKSTCHDYHVELCESINVNCPSKQVKTIIHDQTVTEQEKPKNSWD